MPYLKRLLYAAKGYLVFPPHANICQRKKHLNSLKSFKNIYKIIDKLINYDYN